MTHIFKNAAEILLLLFLVITFIQSAVDKLIDWRGNLSWFKGHFMKTTFKDIVPFLLGFLVFMEMVSGILCAIGVIVIFFTGQNDIALYGSVFSAISLLVLLLGQRMAKDYDGARTIVIYFIPTVFLVFLLQG